MADPKELPASKLKVGDRIEYRGDQMSGYYTPIERWHWFTSTITRIETATRQDSLRLYVCTGNNRFVLVYKRELIRLVDDEPTTMDNLMPQMPRKVVRTGRSVE
jgi:hypothetical protein